jgi:hypothetical protein
MKKLFKRFVALLRKAIGWLRKAIAEFFYKLYCRIMFNQFGQLIYGILLFIAGLVGASETGAVGKIVFIGIIGVGGFTLWSAGMMNKWKQRWLGETYEKGGIC